MFDHLRQSHSVYMRMILTCTYMLLRALARPKIILLDIKGLLKDRSFLCVCSSVLKTVTASFFNSKVGSIFSSRPFIKLCFYCCQSENLFSIFRVNQSAFCQMRKSFGKLSTNEVSPVLDFAIMRSTMDGFWNWWEL